MTSISIVEFQSSWRHEFESIAQNIRSVVSNQAIRIDHIGSTAVKGLAAKDVIDIQVTIESLDQKEDILILQKNGYQLRDQINHDLLIGFENDSPELRKRFFRERFGERRANIHIREQGRVNQQYPLIFRDYLRSNIAVRDAYSTIKKELVKRFSNDENSYYDIKDPYMDTIFHGAKLWSQLNDWKPDNVFL